MIRSQFTIRTLLLLVVAISTLFVWIGAVAEAARVSRLAVLLVFIVGFAVGALIGFVVLIASRSHPDSTKALKSWCVLLPGIFGGCALAFLVFTHLVFSQRGTLVLAFALTFGSIGTLLFCTFELKARSRLRTDEPAWRRYRWASVLAMAALLIAAIVAAAAITTSDGQWALRPDRREVLLYSPALYNVPVDTPVMISDIKVGRVATVEPVREGTGALFKLQIQASTPFHKDRIWTLKRDAGSPSINLGWPWAMPVEVTLREVSPDTMNIEASK